MHSYEAWAGLLKFINDLCLYQVTLNHLIPRGHVELMPLPTVYLKKKQVRCVYAAFMIFNNTLKNTNAPQHLLQYSENSTGARFKSGYTGNIEHLVS